MAPTAQELASHVGMRADIFCLYIVFTLYTIL